MESDYELTVLHSLQSRVAKHREKCRRRRQRRRERKQQKGSETPVDDELAMQMQVCALHEPKETNLEEESEPEQINLTESFDEDLLDS